LLIHEGGTTGQLYVLIDGRLEVIEGDTVVASIADPGAVVGEMSVLLDKPHTATVRANSHSTICEFGDAASFLREQPAVALLSPAESRKAALSSISSTMQTARLRPALNTQVVPSRSNHDPSGNESRLMHETRDHLDERDPFAQAPRRGRG
jgi:CRP-like cAMP-binding protein